MLGHESARSYTEFKKSEFLSLKVSPHPWDMKNGCKVVDKLVSISMNDHWIDYIEKRGR